jgi:hypothetical protein
MNYAEADKARRRLAQAAATVVRLDARMVSAELQTLRPGARGRAGTYALHAVRLTKEGLKARGDLLLPLDPQTERERRKVKRAIRTAERQRHSNTVRYAYGEMDAE